MKDKVLVTGGAGYVGSVLVPKILEAGFEVSVLDLMIFGENVLDACKDKIKIIKGDIRDKSILEKSLEGIDSVIHLAAISNDPSADLDSRLSIDVNYCSTKHLLELSKKAGVNRFIYASSSSVYGVKEEENVTEDLSLRPLTIYSHTKAASESIVKEHNCHEFTTVNIRPATVCGYSPRQRLDVVVNIFANNAINKKMIRVDGGSQRRPNIHIKDMADYYVALLNAPKEKISGETFNAGYENYSLNEIAEKTIKVMGEDIQLKVVPTNDNRSYHISSEKISRVLGLKPRHTVEEAIADMKTAFENGLLPDPESSRYYNVKRMKELGIK
jgi:nucleoside-diphosphate-sugar epimerase